MSESSGATVDVACGGLLVVGMDSMRAPHSPQNAQSGSIAVPHAVQYFTGEDVVCSSAVYAKPYSSLNLSPDARWVISPDVFRDIRTFIRGQDTAIGCLVATPAVSGVGMGGI